MTKIIALSSNKGGVLKTSLSVNLAGVMVENGGKILLIDLDNQGNVATSFGKDPDDFEFTIYDLLVNSEELDNPHQAIQNLYPGLDIIGANDNMAYVEIEILTQLDKYPNFFNLLSEALKVFDGEYDYIVLDTPPALGLIAANVFNCANDIVIPFQPEPYGYRSLIKTLEAVKGFKKTNPNINIKEIVPVRVKRTIAHRAYMDTAKMIAKEKNISYSPIVIRDSIKYAEIVGRYNVPITLLEEVPKSIEHYKEDYYNLAKELGYIGK